MPVFMGSTTLSTAAAATAASMALPPRCMICNPACAANGWLVVTMPCGAITSARLCPPQPSARSPGTAPQAGTSGCSAQVESGGVACAKATQGSNAAAISAAAQEAFGRQGWNRMVMDLLRGSAAELTHVFDPTADQAYGGAS